MTGLTNLRILVCAGVIAAYAPAVNAQTATGIPNAVQGFSANRDKPIQINATSLEVRDKDKKATFSGAVQVVQGDTTLRCKVLDVYYEAEGRGGAKATLQAAGNQQQIRRLEAKGGVHVTQNNQTAIGDSGIFDMRSNTMTLLGNVAITQGDNVVRGDRLVVDLTTGVSRVEGVVRALFQPGKDKDNAEARSGKDAAKPAAKSSPSAPLKLN
jgi:lipopolysaccharide export system protein LptA